MPGNESANTEKWRCEGTGIKKKKKKTLDKYTKALFSTLLTECAVNWLVCSVIAQT